MRRILMASACAAFVASAAPAATNLLTNGSFETGNFTGWTVTNNQSSTGTGAAAPAVIKYNQSSDYPTGAFGEIIPTDNAVGNSSPDAAGLYGAYFVSDFANPQTISQMVTLLAGTSYTFGFDIYKPANGDANPNGATFTATVAGATFATFTATALPATTWQTFSGASSFVAQTSGTFAFNFTSDGFPAKDFVIDRVFLTPTADTSAVPEPATWAMMVGGFGLVGGAVRRHRKTAFRFA